MPLLLLKEISAHERYIILLAHQRPAKKIIIKYTRSGDHVSVVRKYNKHWTIRDGGSAKKYSGKSSVFVFPGSSVQVLKSSLSSFCAVYCIIVRVSSSESNAEMRYAILKSKNCDKQSFALYLDGQHHKHPDDKKSCRRSVICTMQGYRRSLGGHLLHLYTGQSWPFDKSMKDADCWNRQFFFCFKLLFLQNFSISNLSFLK